MLLFKKGFRNAWMIVILLCFLACDLYFIYFLAECAFDLALAMIDTYQFGSLLEVFALGVSATIFLWLIQEPLATSLVEWVENLLLVIVSMTVPSEKLRRGYRRFLIEHNMRSKKSRTWQWTPFLNRGTEPLADCKRMRFDRNRTWGWYLKTINPLAPVIRTAYKLVSPPSWL